jgi:cytochrome c
MKTTNSAILAVGISGLLTGGSGALADAALYSAKLCPTCHGADAKSPIMPTYPKLAGQNSEYCRQQVKDIASGARSNGMAAAMKPMVQALTDEEITTLCDYIAGL